MKTDKEIKLKNKYKNITIPEGMLNNIFYLINLGEYASFKDFYLTAFRNEINKFREELRRIEEYKKRVEVIEDIKVDINDNSPIVVEREKIIEKEKPAVEITEEEVQKAKELEKEILKDEVIEDE